MQLTLGSLFDGISGFPLAGARLGIKTLWGSEIEPFPMKVSEIRFPDMKQEGDITKINGAEIEPVDIVTFGSPCTRLSVAGKHDGFDITFRCIPDKEEDEEEREPHYTRTVRATDKYQYIYEDVCPVCGKQLIETNESALFFHAMRIIAEMRSGHETNVDARPRFAVWENVPGAFSSNKGEDFRAVLEETARIADETVTIPRPPGGKWNTCGAIMADGWSIAWRVLDAQYWGVPQRRRRIFLVADFGGQSAPEILFKRPGLQRHIAQGEEAGEGVAANAEGGVGKAIPINTQIATRGNRLGERTGFGIGNEGDPAYTIQEAHSHAVAIDSNCQDSRFKLTGQVVPTIPAKAGTGGNNGPMLAVPAYCIQGSMVGRADKNGPQGDGINEDVSFTLNTTDRHAVAIRTANTGANGHGVADDVAHTLDGANGQAVAQINCQDKSAVLPFDTTQITSPQNRSNPKYGDPCHTFAAGANPPAIIQCIEPGALSRGQGDIAQINCQPSGIAGTVSSKWAKGTGGPAGDEHYNLVCSVDCRNFNETEKHGTLQAKESGGQSLNYMGAVRKGYSVRRLTPLECERLQDFPDGWTDIPGASDSARYKALGNSLAVVCAEYVLEGIAERIFDKT